ncbi:NADH-quinone oxidoreductase subunit L [Halorhodospira abdelmalekii]|uniref:NADH-quinone oxidoreductase subunit L n=1 Tax=Halorhodospira abdelmalekii TaxID=421629 RepID=UPI003B845AF5|nr:NADH-quinone oxidoreductase subunit L [Halorhodospira abdelmalekii]
MEWVLYAIVLLPLIAALIAGIGGPWIGRVGAHRVTIGGVGLATVLSFWVLYAQVWGGAAPLDITVYTWATVGNLSFEIGFLVDRLTAVMMATVTFVALMVHIYTIGYMHDDPGYQRFFSYIALFTFAMLMLVMANNLLQLFFAWEAVGLVSYLLIGFWYTRESAIFANLKAFLVNRVGDLGLLLGIAVLASAFGTLHYGELFAAVAEAPDQTLNLFGAAEWSLITVACVLIFIGCMGKSAQVPLHVWLPDSMEGPTPISALIHAATMVTAGIFLVARLSPLFELSTVALTVVLVVGALTAFFMGLIGLVQNDIKRVVAYSTLSQLGYMVAALGVSAYAAGVYHLFTHAFFKALLFLAAGSVIIALHHEQDMRKMGGLAKYLPITYITMLIGTLALIGFPGFSGFFSKEAVIAAVGYSAGGWATFAYWLLVLGVFVTALYSFRLLFMVFHGEERMDAHAREHLHESPRVVTIPLLLLAVPSVLIGLLTFGPMVIGDFFKVDGSIQVLATEHGLAYLAAGYTGVLGFIGHAFATPVPYLAFAGFLTAWLLYIKRPEWRPRVVAPLAPLQRLLEHKYGFDWLYVQGAAGGGRALARGLTLVGERWIIDGALVNGSARLIGRAAAGVRQLQTGYLYHYAFIMVIGVLLLITLFVVRTVLA